MMNDTQEKQRLFDIYEIIKNEKLVVHFQTIVSLSRKKIIGLEGLIRGIGDGEHILPVNLFEAAYYEKAILELDRICRDKVLEAYSKLYSQDKNMILFLNLDASILDEVAGSNYLISQVKLYNLNPRNIVIEINESKVKDDRALKLFCDTYRKMGFMIALDDVGTGSSNMDRILLVKPDIIKIDISLSNNIQNDYYKQGIISSLINLSNMIGALVVAEGIENKDEAIEILKLGGHMMQGFFFSKPQEITNVNNIIEYNQIQGLNDAFHQHMKTLIDEEKKKNKKLNKIVDYCINELASVTHNEFDNKLLQITWAHKNIECVYILNSSGMQISNTIRYCNENGVKNNLFFYSARVGTDHTMDKYYYLLRKANLNKYVTEPYVSMATGNLCITISKVFKNKENLKFILCVDFNTTDYALDLEPSNEINLSNLTFNINGKTITELNRMIHTMNEEIIKDSLTNTYNRRYMEERLLVEVFNASNSKQPISVILADIDYFKKVNDTYGHIAGDHVLKEFAKIAKLNIRKTTDWIARYGGEEFLIVLLNANENVAYKVAEKIRYSLENECIEFHGMMIQITASFGTYTLNNDKIMTYETLIDLADKNLYTAKNNGRNVVIPNKK
jgi:diguanylate cyclase (GGDEF)-like protein